MFGVAVNDVAPDSGALFARPKTDTSAAAFLWVKLRGLVARRRVERTFARRTPADIATWRRTAGVWMRASARQIVKRDASRNALRGSTAAAGEPATTHEVPMPLPSSLLSSVLPNPPILPRLLALPVLALLASASLSCARPAAVATAAPRVPDPTPFAVAYRVMRSGDGDGVLLTGHMDVGTRDSGRVESTGAHHDSGQELQLSLPGGYEIPVMLVRYEELGPSGANIKCQSVVPVTRGAPVRAECGGAGWGRAIELTVQ